MSNTAANWQTFAEFVTVCRACGAEVETLSLDEHGHATIQPCGHPPDLQLAPNPRLPND